MMAVFNPCYQRENRAASVWLVAGLCLSHPCLYSFLAYQFSTVQFSSTCCVLSSHLHTHFLTQRARCAWDMRWPFRAARLPGHIQSRGFPWPVRKKCRCPNVTRRVGHERGHTQRWRDNWKSKRKAGKKTGQSWTLCKQTLHDLSPVLYLNFFYVIEPLLSISSVSLLSC